MTFGHYKRMVGLADIEKNKKILDCACGAGKGVRIILNFEPSKLVCVDIDMKQLEKCRNSIKDNAEYICSDLCELVLKEEFDYYFCMETLEHLREEQNRKAAETITRLIKKGGKLLVSVPGTLGKSSKHRQTFTRDKLLSLFTGFILEAEGNFTIKRASSNLYVFRKIRRKEWYQIINIDGKLTKGEQGKGDVEKTWENVKLLLPSTLKGLRILDLGCNAGMYCVNSILMGAREVVGIEADESYFKQALFVKEYMEKEYDGDMNIRYIHGEIYEHIADLGLFDIIYAFSVLYHIEGSHIDAVCRHIARNTGNIIARFRNKFDISKYTTMFGKHGFRIYNQFEEIGLFKNRKKKYLVQYRK